MVDNKRQHVVPRFYLSHFTDVRGQVHVWDRKNCKTFSSAPERLAIESDCYTVMRDGIRETAADEINQEIESFCAPHLWALTASAVPTRDQWRAVSLLTANLISRSRQMRDRLHARLDKPMQMLDRKHGFWDWAARLDPKLASAREDIRRAREVIHSAIVGAGPKPVAEDLSHKPCQLLVAPAGSRFITSDDPVLVLKENLPTDVQLTSAFLRDESISIFLPLRPGLACRWGTGPTMAQQTLSADDVRHRNLLVCGRAYRQVFAADNGDLLDLRSKL